MTPLNLTKAPPRAPRAELDGLMFLPRSIDKVRASLPGGDLGVYTIPGFTEMMLEKLGVSVADFTATVAQAQTDADVAVYLRKHATQDKYDAWNGFISQRQPRGGNREEALTVFPWLGTRPDLVLAVDVLEEDDKQSFAAAK
jgi:hypothetical protein